VRNWQRRYFVLDMGILKYYEKAASIDSNTQNTVKPATAGGANRRFSMKRSSSNHSHGQIQRKSSYFQLPGENLKGQMGLAGTTVKIHGKDRIYLSEGQDGSKDLLLQVELETRSSTEAFATSAEAVEALCQLWYLDFQHHINFASDNVHLVDFQSTD
jgi:hypothetical protein